MSAAERHVPRIDDLQPEDPDDPDAWAPAAPIVLPPFEMIAVAARELEQVGNPNDTPEQLAALAFDLAAARAERAERGTEPPLLEQLDALAATVRAVPFSEPEDRGDAVLSDLGDVEYIEDLVRPGRIGAWAGEEGSGKSFTLEELAIRAAVAGGSFAGAWPVLRTGPVLYLSEMHPDDDYGREAMILGALGLGRESLRGRLYRLPLMTAAGGPPALTVAEWRGWITGWMRDHGVLLMIFDTGTGATQVDPWGQAIQGVYRDLRAMLEAYPQLAIVLALHLKKPQGRGDRRISDVLGEWGRWCDVVVLQEADGTTRTKLATFKRVRRQRRIVATRADGLLVDPVDMDTVKGSRVAPDAVLAAVEASPGITYDELGAALGVSARTAARYVKDLGDAVDTVAGTARGGPNSRVRVFPVSSSRHDSTGARDETLTRHAPVPGAESRHRDTHPIGVSRHDVTRSAPCFADAVLFRSHASEHYQTADGWGCRRCEGAA